MVEGEPLTSAAPGRHSFTTVMARMLVLHRQARFVAVLSTAVETLAELDAPAYVGSLMRDPGSDRWHLTALLDPDCRPVDLEDAAVAPCAFSSPEEPAQGPLAAVMQGAWPADLCARVEAQLGTTTAVAVPIDGAGVPRAAFLAFPLAPEHADLVAGVLQHAAFAASHHLERRGAVAGEEMLSAELLVARAGDEIARARRYSRRLATVVCRVDRPSDLGALGALLAMRVRRWDVVGLLPGEEPAVAAVLPETPRDGVLGFIARLHMDLAGVEIGAALLPEDGDSFAALAAVARQRSVRFNADPIERGGGLVQGQVWTLGAPVGPGPETVLCPTCLVPYSRTWPVPTGTPVADFERAAARIRLNADCPVHPPRLVIAAAADHDPIRASLFSRKGGALSFLERLRP